MQATIIFNEQAGSTKHIPLETVKATLLEQGYFPLHKATESEADLDDALADAEGLVLVAGGDGTIRATALHLIGRPGVKLAFLPAGTANNISKSFGVELGWQAVLAGLGEAREQAFDVGRIRGPLGERYFLEAFGCGLYADVLALYAPELGKSVGRAIGALSDLLPNFEPYDLRVSLDGVDHSGRYLLLEALNISMTGPNMKLAPDADSADGLLDIVMFAEDQRAGFLEYARRAQAGSLEEHDSVTVTRCAKLELAWTGFPVHLDGVSLVDIDDPDEMQRLRRVSPELKDERETVIAVDVLPGALTLLLPESADGSSASLPSSGGTPVAGSPVAADSGRRIDGGGTPPLQGDR